MHATHDTYKSNEKRIFSRKWKKKNIEITREMILFDDPNEIIERKSKTEGKWLQFESRKRMRTTRKMTFLTMKVQKWSLFSFTRDMESKT